MMRSGSVYGAAALAEKERASHQIRAILKAAVAANTSVSVGDAISYQTVASAWMVSLRNVGTFDREGEHRRVCQIGFYKAVAAIEAHVKGEMDKARASLAARH